MLGLNSTVAVYRRIKTSSTNTLETTASLHWQCDIQPISPSVTVLPPTLASSTHRGIGLPAPVLEQGWQLEMDGRRYSIIKVDPRKRRGAVHHQECYLVRAE